MTVSIAVNLQAWKHDMQLIVAAAVDDDSAVAGACSAVKKQKNIHHNIGQWCVIESGQ